MYYSRSNFILKKLPIRLIKFIKLILDIVKCYTCSSETDREMSCIYTEDRRSAQKIQRALPGFVAQQQLTFKGHTLLITKYVCISVNYQNTVLLYAVDYKICLYFCKLPKYGPVLRCSLQNMAVFL